MVVDDLAGLLADARAWMAQDPDPVTRPSWMRWSPPPRRATLPRRPTWPSVSPAAWSSARRACAASSAPARCG